MRYKGSMRSLLVFAFLLTAGCQTAQQKSEALVIDRAAKLKHLSNWKSTWCQVDTELTEPAKARFTQMFPFEPAGDMSFAWRAREASCEVTALSPSSAAKGQAAFLDTALCLLMQVHYINSPFDELEVTGKDIEPVRESAHIKSGDNPTLGIFLPPDSFTVETRTKARGTLRVDYADQGGKMLPSRLEQDRGKTKFLVDELEYETSGSRPMLKAFSVSLGGEKTFKQSRAIVRDCRPL